MEILNQSNTMSRQNTKKKQTYTFDLSLHESLLRTYVVPAHLEKMTNKYKKKVTFELLTPEPKTCATECKTGCCNHEEKYWILRASGRHRQTVRDIGKDMVERFNNIVHIINRIHSDQMKKGN